MGFPSPYHKNIAWSRAIIFKLIVKKIVTSENVRISTVIAGYRDTDCNILLIDW